MDDLITPEEARRISNRKSSRKYAQANREKVNAWSRRYRKANLEKRKAIERRYRAKHGERIKLTQRLRPLGLSVEQYNEMLARQGGCCAICERPPQGKRPLAIDHDHQTGRVRKLLCHHCNCALGYARDDPAVLRNAAAYIEEHK